jgi:hypothetical protein
LAFSYVCAYGSHSLQTVKSFEIVDSLDTANERMAQLVAEGGSAEDDSAGIRLTASLALLIPALFALFQN